MWKQFVVMASTFWTIGQYSPALTFCRGTRCNKSSLIFQKSWPKSRQITFYYKSDVYRQKVDKSLVYFRIKIYCQDHSKIPNHVALTYRSGPATVAPLSSWPRRTFTSPTRAYSRPWRGSTRPKRPTTRSWTSSPPPEQPLLPTKESRFSFERR